MATTVYLVKRYLRSKKRNGQREYRWALRWEDADGWHCASTKTADRTQAESLQKLRWAEINGLTPKLEPEPDQPAKLRPTWQECRDALERAMEADNLRPGYVADALSMYDQLQRAFPAYVSPADVTADDANEFKRRRCESGNSPWSTKGDLATLKAVFGKWLGQECGLLTCNPFAGIRPPKCDDPDVRIVTEAETTALLKWLDARWNNWKLPRTYLEVLGLLGWRATEVASIREEDLLADGFVRCIAQASKTRKQKHGWLPPELYAELKACCSNGHAFGRFSDELRRLLILWKRSPHNAARVKDFTPDRLVGWMQDELTRYHKERQKAEKEAAEKAGRKAVQFETFTLHDFRRTAITGLQMAGVSEKEASVMVGATPEVIRRHYEKLDQQKIARRSIELRLGIVSAESTNLARRLRAGESAGLDESKAATETYIA